MCRLERVRPKRARLHASEAQQGHLGTAALGVLFAAFPVAVVTASDMAGLMLAFVVGGLREIGEPARKALIVDFAEPHLRARSVGLYYLLRSLAIAPAAFVGGLLWAVAPSMPFYIAGATGIVGTVLFALTVEEQQAA